MKANKLYAYYKDLPPWTKGVVVVGGLLVVYIVAKKFKGLIFPSASQQRNAVLAKDIGTEIARLKRTMTQSYPSSTYSTLANSIYNGMRYCLGDDYGTVADSMKKMKNDLDVALLIQAYGFRQKYCFGIAKGEASDLMSSVQEELGQEWGGLTNYRIDQINNDWASKGITYKL